MLGQSHKFSINRQASLDPQYQYKHSPAPTQTEGQKRGGRLTLGHLAGRTKRNKMKKTTMSPPGRRKLSTNVKNVVPNNQISITVIEVVFFTLSLTNKNNTALMFYIKFK